MRIQVTVDLGVTVRGHCARWQPVQHSREAIRGAVATIDFQNGWVLPAMHVHESQLGDCGPEGGDTHIRRPTTRAKDRSETWERSRVAFPDLQFGQSDRQGGDFGTLVKIRDLESVAAKSPLVVVRIAYCREGSPSLAKAIEDKERAHRVVGRRSTPEQLLGLFQRGAKYLRSVAIGRCARRWISPQ